MVTLRKCGFPIAGLPKTLGWTLSSIRQVSRHGFWPLAVSFHFAWAPGNDYEALQLAERNRHKTNDHAAIAEFLSLVLYVMYVSAGAYQAGRMNADSSPRVTPLIPVSYRVSNHADFSKTEPLPTKLKVLPEALSHLQA